jgi:hypothetical protein
MSNQQELTRLICRDYVFALSNKTFWSTFNFELYARAFVYLVEKNTLAYWPRAVSSEEKKFYYIDTSLNCQDHFLLMCYKTFFLI